jgi:putative membrane protein
MKRTLAQKGLLTLKGMAMGAADVVPGVSGGTIAFITGIYEELISSINNINLDAFKLLKKEGLKAFWNHINGTFFVFLLAGVAISVLTLAKVVLHLLEAHPVLIWSFFFGLIIASSILVGKTIKQWTIPVITFFAIGTIIAMYISSIETTTSNTASWYIFLSGCIAICAMILPGISGSFILVLMGSYHVVLTAIKEKEIVTLLLFMSGCLVGILSFARLLKWLFSKYKEITIALLTGFMIGSLYKVWPWKVQVGAEPLVIHSDGREDWMMSNVLPSGFDGDPKVIMAVVCGVFGLALVLFLERIGTKRA